MSKATRVTAQATITGVRNIKQVRFNPRPEDCYGRCGMAGVGCGSQSMMKMNWSGVADEPRHLPPDKARQ